MDLLPPILTDHLHLPRLLEPRGQGLSDRCLVNRFHRHPPSGQGGGEISVTAPGENCVTADTEALAHTEGGEAHTHPATRFRRSAAVVATGFGRGPRVNWFVDVLARGLSRLDPHVTASRPYTGDVLKPSVRISESFRPHGGYDKVVARVEVTRPARGLGDALVAAGLGKSDEREGDPRDARHATLARVGWKPDGDHPHPDTQTFVLYDDGTHGDHLPNNHYWTVDLPADFARGGATIATTSCST